VKTDVAELIRSEPALYHDSLGLAARNDKSPKKKEKYKLPWLGEIARSCQQQNGKMAQRFRHQANLGFADALGNSTRMPFKKKDKDGKIIKDSNGNAKWEYPAPEMLPRSIGIQLWVTNVKDIWRGIYRGIPR
jgi:hypothetical protein